MKKDIARSETRWKTLAEIQAGHGETELLQKWLEWKRKRWKRRRTEALSRLMI